MRKQYIVNISILISMTTVCFICAEILIRSYLKYHIIYDIEMTEYSNRLKIDSNNPLIGHIHRPHSSARLMGVDVNINSDGFRDEDYPRRKGDKYRMIFLGDSLTFGWGVNKDDTFESILEARFRRLRPTEIINFAAGNYNTVQEVNLFMEKGLEYFPDKVVVFYFINDAEDVPNKSNLWLLGYSKMITFYWSRTNALLSKLSASKGYKDYYRNLYHDNQTGWIQAKRAFIELKQLLFDKHISLQVVLLPEFHELKNYPFVDEYRKVTTFLTDNGIDVIDLSPCFDKVENSQQLWVAMDDAHPNARAHALIAEYSFEFLAKDVKQ